MALSSLRSFLLLLSSTLFTSTLASPIPTSSQTTFIEQITTHSLSKRGQSSRKIGINLCITISIIVCAALFFYLGMRKSKHPGTWLCFRIPNPKNLPKPAAKLPSWPWVMKPDWTYRSLTWPWQRIPTPVFELEAKEARRRTLRRSWLWERTRNEHEEALGTQSTHVDISPITPIARSRDQIREARRKEIEGRGRTEEQRQEVERRGRTEEERRIIQQRLDLDLNVYEMGSSASHRSPSPRPPTSGSTQSKPQNWFQHWRYYFEQAPTSSDLDSKREHRLTQASIPRRWYSVKSVKSTISRKSSVRKYDQNLQSRWSKSTTYSVYELDGQPNSPPPAYPEKAYYNWGRLSGEKAEGGMDWRGADFMKKMYEKRVSGWRAA